MGHFLNSYKQKLEQENVLFLDENLQVVMSAVEVQARGHHMLENRQQCKNINSDLEVRDVDDFGFVTSVRCTECGQILDTRFNVGQEMDHFIDSYKNKLRERNISGFHDDELKTVLAAVVVLKCCHEQTCCVSTCDLCCVSTLCRRDNADTLEVADVDRYGLVTEVTCVTCEKSINPTCYVKRNTVNFLNSYKAKLSEKRICVFLDEQLETVLSAVVLRVRIRRTDNQLCCRNDENRLEVTDVDRYGFVTEVKCTICQKSTDTTCSNAKWWKRRIYDETELRVGDHICWQRPCTTWHHAIVTAKNPTKVIHYDGELAVRETQLSDAHRQSRCCKFYNNLYRINHTDSYNADYTVLRARKMLGEEMYNMLEQNCEHFSSWCKTGSTKSNQVNIWTSLGGRVAATIILRVIALRILFEIHLLHEISEQMCQGNRTVTKDSCVIYETVERVLTSVYIVVATMIFVIHLVVTSGQLPSGDPGSENNDHYNLCPCCPRNCSEVHYCSECCQSSYDWCLRCCYCLGRMFSVLCCRAVQCLFCITWCRHIGCCPCTCCRRPGKLACGVFWRIFIREVPGMVATIVIVVLEENVGQWLGIQQYSADIRAFTLILFIALIQLGSCVIFLHLYRSIFL